MGGREERWVRRETSYVRRVRVVCFYLNALTAIEMELSTK